MQHADFSAREVPAPHGNWCKSGHRAPDEFRRDGPDLPATPTKFFSVRSDQAPQVNGTYCELCLIVANAVKRGELTVKPG